MSKPVVLIQQCDIRNSPKAGNFASLKLNLGRAGEFAVVDAKIWQTDRLAGRGLPMPEKGRLMRLDNFKKDEFKGREQWIVEDFSLLSGSEHEAAIAAFVPPRLIDAEYYERRVEELIDEVDPARVCAQVLLQIFDRPDFREAFYRSPAAVGHHQQYPGGLLEHTINVTSLALALADAFAAGERPGLTVNAERLPVDRMLLIAAGLLHDIGKIEAYRLAPISETTDAHSFEGHLAIGYAHIRENARPLMENPPYPGAREELNKLLNCILSHHGSLEFGSPVLPACIEAFLLAQADMTDARLASIVSEGNRARRANPEAQWLRHYHFPGGMFIGDWPKPEERR